MSINQEQAESSGRISYARLVWEAVPEIYIFQLLSWFLLSVLSWALNQLISGIAESGGVAATTANISDFLFTWRGPAVILLGFALVSVFIIFEIFASIHMCADILNGKRVSLFGSIRRGFRSMRKFLCPGGLPVLIYIFLAVPLCGIGFSISLSRDFYIPRFIMSVIESSPLYYLAYTLLMLAMLAAGIRGIFSIHAVLIDGMTPSEGRRASSRIMRGHWKKLLRPMFLTALLLALLNTGFKAALTFLYSGLEAHSPADYGPAVYRFLCALVVIGGSLLGSMLAIFSGYCLKLLFTRCYIECTRGAESLWPERIKHQHYRVKLAFMLFTFAASALFTAAVGAGLTSPFTRNSSVKIVAHRAGGVMAPENSLEGLERAIEHGCYGSETDTQRTADGEYIINHDDSFKRLTGVDRKPAEMTLAEVRKLTITDPATGRTASVPTAWEMLDTIKGREKLFLELKGATADRRMADDLVKIIREKNCAEDVVLISLKYSVMDYVKTRYPEFQTGILIFGGIGNVARLNCDIIIMEEEMTSDRRISQIHAGGKQAFVWTVNTEAGLYRAMRSECDGIITDQVELARRVQEKVEARSELQRLRDQFWNIWD
ncbi:MAG: glycerophosphoryl diester phosphodiesterase membrane domain-containing protein [Synergistaceae bacterium]|nr:glycerophosphoryl diester phosphodiesterase membrane domain-containing protein [Synergistaceae bacterium]